MTSTQTKKPRAAKRRRKTTPKPMTEQSYPVTKEEEKVILPVVLPKPTDDIIPLSSYITDAKNRWKIHQYEIKELSKDTQWIYNKAKPFVEKVVARLSPKGS